MENAMKRLKICALVLALVLSLGALSSCYSLGGIPISGDKDYLTEEELRDILDEYERAENDYNITITPSGDSSLLAASSAVLSVVSIYCGFNVRHSSRPSASVTTATSAGSGVIYKLDKASGDAYIITNYHVVFNEYAVTDGGISEDISLYLYGQQTYGEQDDKYKIEATYVGGSMSYDLAVLKVEDSDVLKMSNATAAKIADSNEVALLETAIAIGNPEGLGISATVGNVNVDSEYISIGITNTNSIVARVIRTDAAVNGGNSGGGLFNSSGELIGIVNAKLATSDVDNIGYAIPSNIAKNMADNIIYYCDGTDKTSPYRCLLGITVGIKSQYTEYDLETGKVLKRELVRIDEIGSGALAEGKLLVGDVVKKLTVDTKECEIFRTFHLIDCMLNARVGSTVVFDIERAGEPLRITIIITEATLTVAP